MQKITAVLLCFIATMAQAQQKAPAYPLITHDPYFSILSMSDKLNETTTKHWTNADQSLIGIIKVDDKFYRVLGRESRNYESIVPTADEQGYKTQYTFSQPGTEWYAASYNDETWNAGDAPFFKNRNIKGTAWDTKDVWVRRTFEANVINADSLALKIQYDDDVEVYLNGEAIFKTQGFIRTY